jgi:hypothetical protein
MVHTLPVKRKSAMLNIAEQLGIRNARRNGLRPYRTRNNSRGSSAEETAAGQCRRLAGHGPVSITGRRPEFGVMVGAISDCAQNPAVFRPFASWPVKRREPCWRGVAVRKPTLTLPASLSLWLPRPTPLEKRDMGQMDENKKVFDDRAHVQRDASEMSS